MQVPKAGLSARSRITKVQVHHESLSQKLKLDRVIEEDTDLDLGSTHTCTGHGTRIHASTHMHTDAHPEKL